MERLFLEFAIRAALIVLTTAIVLRALRVRAATAQHAVWAGVLMVMLLLPAWLAWGPKAAMPVLPSRPAIVTNTAPASFATPAAAIPILLEIAEAPAAKPSVWSGNAALLAFYLLGALALLLRLAIGTVRASRLTSASCVAPVTVGVLRPRIILPECWSQWPQVQLDAVLTHERAHARRRDPLFQWLALFNRAVFWFHPLAWWLERRLSALAEEACDAAVLERGHDPRDYSEYLLELARAVQRAGTRVNALGLAMPGSYLPQRVKNIIDGVRAPRISPMRMTFAALACVIPVAVFAAGTLDHIPQTLPLRPLPAWPLPQPPVLVAQATTPQVVAQSPPVATPKFEVASIRPSTSTDCGEGSERGGRSGGRSNWSPGTLSLECQTVHSLIQLAYDAFANGQRRPPGRGIPIEKGPAWIDSSRYTIKAKAEDAQGEVRMKGVMLQALLEDRFKLKIHQEAREVPVYALTVAKGGPKGLRVAQKGTCIIVDADHPWPPRAPGEPDPRACGMFYASSTSEGPDVFSTTMVQLARQFSVLLDRDVIDKTGIAGTFDLHLEMSPADLPAPPADAAGRPGKLDPDALQNVLQDAVEKLGLKLESVKAPGEFLVIDSVERPSEN